ncbi:MAG TPA: ABC transporter permease [Chthoniobacterales bacterium]|jgi:putative ABC transport system permease protein|nr:ABC transporter permease [Chthoniobacterales bacterium]
MNDLRFALRQLWKSPGFAIVAIVTLALGIGANTAIFSVIESALLRPLPFPKADRLVRVYETFDENGARSNTLNLAEKTVQRWREFGSDIFEGIGAATGASVIASNPGAPAQSFPAARISANFLTVLGLQPVRGRNFTEAEDQPGGPHVVLIGYDFWQRNLGGREDVLGQTIKLDDAVYTVVGVMPKTFRHPYRAELWLPIGLNFAANSQSNHYLYGVARLRPGISLEQADAAGRRMCAAINQAAPDKNNALRAYMIPLRDSFIRNLRPKLLLIAGAALCALLVAAANFAGLLLARVVERDGEMALRAAIGATRGRLIREGLVQALALATIGTIFGLLIAGWLTPALVALSPEGADATGSAIREFDYGVRLDWPVFVFATGAMLLIGVGFGLLPAWRASRTDLRGALGSIGRGTTVDGATKRLLGGLIVMEIAIAAVLLMGSLTLTQYFRKIVQEPWGFATDHRIVFNSMLSERLFDSNETRIRAIDKTLAELRALPGVRSAAVTAPSPMEAARDLMSCVPEGTQPPEPRGIYVAYMRGAGPGYFATVGQRLLRGREFAATDTADAPQVCIVNESFARRFWPGQDPLGKRVKHGRLDNPRPWYTVVGVVADTKAVADPNDGEVVGTVALPLSRWLAIGGDEMTYVIESAGETKSLEQSLRTALARADKRLAAYAMIPLDAAAAETWVTERFLFVLVSLFGLLGLALASIGVYGLLALQVTRRTREFGIRLALGATARGLIQLVAAQGARLLLLGFFAGAIAAWAVTRIVRSQWPELPATNPLIWLGSVIVLGFGVAIASWLPARRASRVDPIIALRAE